MRPYVSIRRWQRWGSRIVPMLPRGRMFRMELVNIEKMPSVLPQWRSPQNLFRYLVSPGRCLLPLKSQAKAKLTVLVQPVGLSFNMAQREGLITIRTTMVEQTMCKKLQAWRWTR